MSASDNSVRRRTSNFLISARMDCSAEGLTAGLNPEQVCVRETSESKPADYAASFQRSRPRLLTAAAWSGLRPAPESRFRRAYLHLLRSCTTAVIRSCSLLSICLCSTLIPNKSNRVTLHSFSKRAYKGRNVIERCFCRLKDFRRVATRYDKLARNFMAAVHLAAIVAFWIN